MEGAVLHESGEVLTQVDSFLNGKVQLWNSEEHQIQVESICLHSDTEGAVTLSKTIHDFLVEKNIKISAVG